MDPFHERLARVTLDAVGMYGRVSHERDKTWAIGSPGSRYPPAALRPGAEGGSCPCMQMLVNGHVRMLV